MWLSVVGEYLWLLVVINCSLLLFAFICCDCRLFVVLVVIMVGGYDRSFVILHGYGLLFVYFAATGVYLNVLMVTFVNLRSSSSLCADAHFRFRAGGDWIYVFLFYFAASPFYFCFTSPHSSITKNQIVFYADWNFISATMFYIDFLFLLIASYWCVFLGYLLFFVVIGKCRWVLTTN